MKLRSPAFILLLLGIAIYTAIGCTDSDTTDIQDGESISETGHEGHDHDPGEGHGQAEAEPGHEGHDHPPGEDHGGESGIATALDWCMEHSVPESECTICDPSLIETFKGFGDWCDGHDLPESHCRLCNPGLVFRQESRIRLQTMTLATEAVEIDLNFRDNAEACATDGALIQFASNETAEKAGISVVSAGSGRSQGEITAPAEVVFDEGYMTVVSSSVPTLVSRWIVSPGDEVNLGDILAIVQSPRIAELKAQLLAATAEHERQKRELDRHRQLQSRELISEAEFDLRKSIYEKSFAELNGARGLLLSAGLSEGDIEEFLKNRDHTNRYALQAPADGIVVERTARMGELIEEGMTLAVLADPSEMWIEARLTEEQLRRIEIGEDLVFSSDGNGINRIGAEVIWISRILDQHTRTGTVRARVLDRNHQLRSGEFGRAVLTRTDRDPVALVPKDAVQWEGCCNVVFVREATDRYRPRKVDIYDSSGPYYQVTSGVIPGEEVVVDGAFLLKTELKKSSIGAGCCGLDPVG